MELQAMNDTGKNIVTGFRELRKFCNQVNLLLKTTQGMLKGEHWKTAKPPAVSYTYHRIDWPDWWLPYEFVRFFENSEVRLLLPYVAVNLDYPDEAYPVDSALLSVGCIVCQSEKKHEKAACWMARWHLFMDARTDDGSLCRQEPRKTWTPKNKTWTLDNNDSEPPAGVLRVTTFAYRTFSDISRAFSDTFSDQIRRISLA
jgi:hypothetical protein